MVCVSEQLHPPSLRLSDFGFILLAAGFVVIVCGIVAERRDWSRKQKVQEKI